MPTKDLSERPPKVILAARLFYLVLGLGVIRTTMTAIRHADVRSPYFLISLKFLLYAICLFLIVQLGKGKNWAKWSLVVILAFAIPLSILPAFDALTHNLVHTLLGFLALALYLIGLVFLFHKSCSHWFLPEKVSEE